MMTRMILGALGAMFVTAGAGGVTVYHHARSSRLETRSASVSAEQSESPPEATQPQRARQRGRVLGIVTDKDGSRRSAKIGSEIEAQTDGNRQSARVGAVQAEQKGNKSSVKVGQGVSVEQQADDGTVQIGNTRVKQNGKHVSIGGVSVYAP